MTYGVNRDSHIASSLSAIWGLDLEHQSGGYADDYNIIKNTLDPLKRTAWTDKYTAIVFNERSEIHHLSKRPHLDPWLFYVGAMETKQKPTSRTSKQKPPKNWTA